MEYARTITMNVPYEQAVEAVQRAFADQGFGTLTEINVQATLASKLDAEIEPYLILGACNPALAARALDADRSIGLLLPCNVVIRALGQSTTLVQALDPQVMVSVPGNRALQPVATEAAQRIRAALDTLTS